MSIKNPEIPVHKRFRTTVRGDEFSAGLACYGTTEMWTLISHLKAHHFENCCAIARNCYRDLAEFEHNRFELMRKTDITPEAEKVRETYEYYAGLEKQWKAYYLARLNEEW